MRDTVEVYELLQNPHYAGVPRCMLELRQMHAIANLLKVSTSMCSEIVYFVWL